MGRRVVGGLETAKSRRWVLSGSLARFNVSPGKSSTCMHLWEAPKQTKKYGILKISFGAISERTFFFSTDCEQV